jgi:hypothetical protein
LDAVGGEGISGIGEVRDWRSGSEGCGWGRLALAEGLGSVDACGMRLNVQIAFAVVVATTLPVGSQTPGVAVPAAPGVAATGIPVETVGSMPVQTVLPGRLLSGPGWRVRDQAPTDGYAGWYTLECEYGTFGCMGIEMLEERVRELYAIR